MTWASTHCQELIKSVGIIWVSLSSCSLICCQITLLSGHFSIPFRLTFYFRSGSLLFQCQWYIFVFQIILTFLFGHFSIHVDLNCKFEKLSMHVNIMIFDKVSLQVL